MDKFYVISPTQHIGSRFCRNILEVNPYEHLISIRKLDKLFGMRKPVIILYPWPDLPDLWNPLYTREMLQMLKSMDATVINMPEVSRVLRP